MGGLGGNDDDWLERPGRAHPRQSTTSISTSAAAAAAAVYRPHGSSSSGSYGKNLSDARSSSGSGTVSVGGHRSTWDVQAIRDSSQSNGNPNPRGAVDVWMTSFVFLINQPFHPIISVEIE